MKETLGPGAESKFICRHVQFENFGSMSYFCYIFSLPLKVMECCGMWAPVKEWPIVKIYFLFPWNFAHFMKMSSVLIAILTLMLIADSLLQYVIKQSFSSALSLVTKNSPNCLNFVLIYNSHCGVLMKI